MIKIFRKQKVWFVAWIQKILGIQSPTCLLYYGRKYMLDYLKDERRGIIQEEQRKFCEEMNKIVGGFQHDENI